MIRLPKEAVGIIALNEKVEKKFSKKVAKLFGDVKTKSIYLRPVLKRSLQNKRNGFQAIK